MESKTICFGKPFKDSDDALVVSDVLRNQNNLTNSINCANFSTDFKELLISLNSEDQGKKPFYALPTSSCMAALHLSYLALGIGKGDEVIVPAMTHVATVHAIELVGARPVFIDCNNYDYNININKIEAAITIRTKAISVVHFMGYPADMVRIVKIAEDYGLKLIEDCALSLGATHRGLSTGLFGDISCFSFYPAKHITTCEGGMFVTKDHNIYLKAKEMSSFGTRKEGGFQKKGSEVKVDKKKKNYDVFSLGSNFRMDELSAALGISQLKKFKKILKLRKKNWQSYYSKLFGIEDLKVMHSLVNSVNEQSYYGFLLLFNSPEVRLSMEEELDKNKIGYSIYYPQPVPRFTYYKEKYGYAKVLYQNAEKIADCSITLPVAPHITEENIEFICSVIKNKMEGVRND